MKDLLRQLLTYNDESIRQFLDAIAAAGPVSERAAVILSHILNAQRIWNARIGGESPTGDSRTPVPPETWADVNRENFRRSLEIVETDDLDRVVDYRDLKGNPYRNRVRDILLHVVNHSSYHRGQLALLLGQQQGKAPFTDYIFYVRDRGL